MRPAICSRRVDLPIPGFPPSRVTDPGTIPPPRVLLNSGSGRICRLVPVDGISPIRLGASLIFGCPLRLIRGASGLLTTSSTKVFHCSQEGQRPSQREEVAAQLEQTKMVRALAKRVNFSKSHQFCGVFVDDCGFFLLE